MISFEFAGKLQENCRIEEENKRGRKTEEEKKNNTGNCTAFCVRKRNEKCQQFCHLLELYI